MEKEAVVKLFGKYAESGAKKICGIGQCIADYDCGHSNRNGHCNFSQKLTGTDVCPLAKYNIKPEESQKPWWERPREEMDPNEDELFSLCACCENSIVCEEQDAYSLERRDITKCFGCPVKMVEDCIQEARAESAMS